MKTYILVLVLIFSNLTFASQYSNQQQEEEQDREERISLIQEEIDRVMYSLSPDQQARNESLAKVMALSHFKELQEDESFNFNSHFRPEELKIQGPNRDYMGAQVMLGYLTRLKSLTDEYKVSMEFIKIKNLYLIENSIFDIDERVERIRQSLDSDLMKSLYETY